jgi:hypothetical protein
MKNSFGKILLAAVLMVSVLPLAAEKPKVRFVADVEHWLGLRHVLEPGDMVVSLAAVRQPQGAFGRERGTPPWRERQLGREIFALDRVDREGIVKGIVFFGLDDFRRNLSRIPRSVSWIFFRTSEGATPLADRTRLRYSVEQFARAAHEGGWKVMWMPDEEMIVRSSGELLKLAQFVDGLQISLPALAGNRDALAFAREARRRIDLVRGFNSRCQVALEIGPEVLADEPTVRALLDLAESVDVISLWAIEDGASALRLIQRLRGGDSWGDRFSR